MRATETLRESTRRAAEAFAPALCAETAGGGSPLVPWQREGAATAPLATTPFVIGHERKADLVWTRQEFLSLCRHMLNGNEPDFFMLAFQDKEGKARFAKAKEGKTFMERRASWAWDTITGRAKSPSGIGFYPRNAEGKTRWAAMDFDAHGPEQTERERARRLAVLRETYREAAEKELERLLLPVTREAEARRRQLERERLGRLRLLFFGPEPGRPEGFR